MELDAKAVLGETAFQADGPERIERPRAWIAGRSSTVARPLQLNLSPYAGPPDLSALDAAPPGPEALDPVSMADLLRNSFVYPPHSIFRNVKVATTGFDPLQDLHAEPHFHFAQQSAAVVRPPMGSVPESTLVETYHRLLCQAVNEATAGMRAPWMLQSGGKDSTSMAMALAEVRPDTTCVTYLGGNEENEVDSARYVATRLGLRHEALACDPTRAYDRYLAMVPRMPLLTADFALLSYADLATEIGTHGGDGMIDALGSDPYFGVPAHWDLRLLLLLARGLRLPPGIFAPRLIARNFRLCYALGTLQMPAFERFYAGSRFTDSEVDALFGQSIAVDSRKRMDTFRADLVTARSMEARRRVSAAVVEAAIFAKGMYTAHAKGLQLAYPYCNRPLCDWVFHEVPDDYLMRSDGTNKVLVRRHIARRFQTLPYVRAKGSFRFDLCGLARMRFDQVHAFAEQGREILPGATRWLERHRDRLDNKYFASKFYLLAVTLPWVLSRLARAPEIEAAD